MALEGEVGFLVQKAVFVSDDDKVGPSGNRVNEEAKFGGIFGEIEFELRGVGVGGLKRCEQRSALDGDGDVVMAGGVDQSHFARGGSKGRIFGTAGRGGGFVEASA